MGQLNGIKGARLGWQAWVNVWRANRSHVGGLLVAGVAVNAFTLVLPLFTIIVYDRIIGNSAYSSLWALAAGVSLAMMFDFILRQVRVVVLEHVGARWDRALDERVFHGILHLPVNAMPRVGAVMVKYREMLAARDFLSSAYLVPLADFPFVFLFLITLYLIGGPIAYIALFWGVALMAATLFAHGRSRRPLLRANQHASEKLSLVVETLVAAEMNRRPDVSSRALGNFIGHSEINAEAAGAARRWQGVSQSLMPSISVLATVTTLIAGTYLVEAQIISMGALIACSMIVSRTVMLFGSVASMAQRYGEFVRAANDLGELVPFTEPKESRKLMKRGMRTRLPSAGYSLIGVGVTRPGQESEILKEVTLRINPKDFVVVLGRSGSGKSTLLRLLSGRIKADVGTVIAGGVEVVEKQLYWLAGCVGYKPQDPSFTTATVDEILREHGPRTKPDQRLEILRRVGLDRAIDAGEISLSTKVQTVSPRISGGQKQMLGLACALLQSDDVLILDEPTTGLDSDATAAVLSLLRGLKGERTIVVATHSQDIVALADRLVVIENGRIRADGKREDLLVIKTENKAAKKTA
jgi:ATP-binding cassette subfamily B protein/ATP-binding cassette subfamily C protein LapB